MEDRLGQINLTGQLKITGHKYRSSHAIVCFFLDHLLNTIISNIMSYAWWYRTWFNGELGLMIEAFNNGKVRFGKFLVIITTAHARNFSLSYLF